MQNQAWHTPRKMSQNTPPSYVVKYLRRLHASDLFPPLISVACWQSQEEIKRQALGINVGADFNEVFGFPHDNLVIFKQLLLYCLLACTVNTKVSR